VVAISLSEQFSGDSNLEQNLQLIQNPEIFGRWTKKEMYSI
jgi:hypothetical protein